MADDAAFDWVTNYVYGLLRALDDGRLDDGRLDEARHPWPSLSPSPPSLQGLRVFG